ncbi:hypothetical protein V6N13_105033 [Hibiscus sabdariffa]
MPMETSDKTDAHTSIIPEDLPLPDVPLSVAEEDFPVTYKNSNRASNLQNPYALSLDKTRHTSVVMDENVDPNLNHMLIDIDRDLDLQTILYKTDRHDLESAPYMVQTTHTTFMESHASDNPILVDIQTLTLGGEQSQGYGHPKFITTVKQFLRNSQPDLVVLVEPRISGRKADSIIHSLGFPQSHQVETSSFSGKFGLCGMVHYTSRRGLRHASPLTTYSITSLDGIHMRILLKWCMVIGFLL